MDKKLIATRDGLGDELVELGKNNKDIYVVDVDIGKSCKTTAFAKAYPEQHVNVGIAEQNGAGLAAGLATCGKIPFVVTYAVLGSLRMCEQIRQEICYPNQRRHRPSGSGGRRGAGWQGNLRPSAGYAHHQASGRRGGQGLCQRHR